MLALNYCKQVSRLSWLIICPIANPNRCPGCNKSPANPLSFYQADIRDKQALTDIFAKESPSTVIHFAGLKAVGESCEQPLLYYHNNVYGTLVLTEVMSNANVKQLVFSSSATVYGESSCTQYTEDFPLGPINPYGRSKAMIEDILRDLSAADKTNQTESPWKIALLRYFNPIGAHESG